jgi:hypothetical protein
METKQMMACLLAEMKDEIRTNQGANNEKLEVL